jgi:glutamine synthetase
MDDPTASQRVCVEYVWVGAGSGLCSKTKVLDAKPSRIEEVPVISVEAEGSFSGFGVQEVYLKPRKLFRDPFRGGDHLLVLCDAFQAPQVSYRPVPKQGF